MFIQPVQIFQENYRLRNANTKLEFIVNLGHAEILMKLEKRAPLKIIANTLIMLILE